MDTPYVDTARAFLNNGLAEAMATFNWPFLPILMATFSKLSGLSLESSGHLLNALFLAGACSLMVDYARRSFPEAIWPICLTILALPGMNHYRNELLREYGCWFFCMLSFWIIMRCSDRHRQPLIIASPLALTTAALFRPEALALLPALVLYVVSIHWKNFRSLLSPGIVGIALVGILISGTLALSVTTDPLSRISGDLGRINLERFEVKTQTLATALIPYARDQAGTILFWGSLALVPLKTLGQLGVFLLPLLYMIITRPVVPLIRRWAPFSWAFVMQLSVLCIFAVDMQFLAGRYVSVLQLFAAPLVGLSLHLLMELLKNWKLAIAGSAVFIMLSNVVSLDSDKQYFIEAGKWLAGHTTDSPRIYMESGRSAYYAGWRFSQRHTPADRTGLPEAVARNEYDLLVFEVARKNSDPTPWIRNLGLQAVHRFEHKIEKVIIARPRQ